MLQKRIEWIQNYSYGNNTSRDDDLKALKQEVAELLEEDHKYDILRSLPLYSTKITGYKYVCGDYFSKRYEYALTRQRRHS